MVSAIFSVSQAWIQLYMYEESSGMQKTFACAGGLVRTRASEQVARARALCVCVCVCVCSTGATYTECSWHVRCNGFRAF